MSLLESFAILAEVLLVGYAVFVLCWASLWLLFKYGDRMTPAFVDGLLYTLMGMGGSAVVCLSDNDVYKYLSAYFVYYAKTISAVTLAGATSLKTFRSTSYGKQLDEKKKSGETAFIPKP